MIVFCKELLMKSLFCLFAKITNAYSTALPAQFLFQLYIDELNKNTVGTKFLLLNNRKMLNKSINSYSRKMINLKEKNILKKISYYNTWQKI